MHATATAGFLSVLRSLFPPSIPLALARKVGSPFPESTFVPVAEACHEPTGCNQCALSIANGFIEPLQPGDWNAPVLKITRVFCQVENSLLYWIPQPFARNGF